MLRDYQKKIICDIKGALRTNRKILIEAPTGAGKTEIIKYIVKYSKVPVNVLTHRKELKKDIESRVDNKNIVFMVETFNARSYVYPRILIIDEAHISNFDKIIEKAPQDTVIIGFSATPIRTGGQKGLDQFYNILLSSVKAQELIQQNYLVPTHNYSHFGIDTKTLKKSNGDYDLNAQAFEFEKRQVYKGVVENYLRICPNTKALAFTSTIESTIQLYNHLAESGLNCLLVHSRMTKSEIDLNIEKFKSSKNIILVNCGILTTGFDCPDIETIILYRATTSRTLFNQMVGRGVRISGNKTHCTVLDFGENIKRFGFWESEYNYTLQKEVKKACLPPVKLCPVCDRMNPTTATNCIKCGHLFVTKKQTKDQDKIIELKKIDKPPMKIGYYLHQVKTQSEALKIVSDFGYKKGWWWMNKKRYPHII